MSPRERPTRHEEASFWLAFNDDSTLVDYDGDEENDEEDDYHYNNKLVNRPKRRSLKSCLLIPHHRIKRRKSHEDDVHQRKVGFGSLSIREYTVVEGDHPCCREYPALMLGWKVAHDTPDIPVELYEAMRAPQGVEMDRSLVKEVQDMRLPRRHRRDLRLDVVTRRRWLGLPEEDTHQTLVLADEEGYEEFIFWDDEDETDSLCPPATIVENPSIPISV